MQQLLSYEKIVQSAPVKAEAAGKNKIELNPLSILWSSADCTRWVPDSYLETII